jgi:hypothetical protein
MTAKLTQTERRLILEKVRELTNNGKHELASILFERHFSIR